MQLCALYGNRRGKKQKKYKYKLIIALQINMKQLKFCSKWSGNCTHDFFSSIKNPNPENRLFFVFFVFSYLVQLMSYYMRLQCIHRWIKKINNVCCITAITLSRKKKANARRKKYSAINNYWWMRFVKQPYFDFV